MTNPLSKTPFISLLIPLIVGILLQYFFKIQYWSIVLFFSGIGAMLLSYFISPQKQFQWRWLFGVGMSLYVIGIGIESTAYRQQESAFTFSEGRCLYRGIVIDMPQEKNRSIAYKILLPDQDKKIICYFQSDTLNKNRLNLGDELSFYSDIQPFANVGDSNAFDYVSYMHNKGFAGWAYVPLHSWEATGVSSFSLETKALECRQKILSFYQALGFSKTEYAILSALTLGYKDALSDDLKQDFQTTGTIHILSVSGLHVGVIYLMINLLLGFIPKRSKYSQSKPVLIILLLWAYAFLTGLSPSVVRASTMLSVFCASEIFNRRSFSIHALYIAAFFMLLVNPFTFFDIGFQLSFSSVWAILYLQPKASKLLFIRNKYLRRIWQMFTLSFVAQLGTFPLCLYYFCTFPTYFFITNLLVVPLVPPIIYATGGIALARGISFIVPDLSSYLYYLPVKILQILIQVLTSLIEFFGSLPFARIENIDLSFLDLLLILTIVWGSVFFGIYRKLKPLIVSLCAVFFLLISRIFSNLSI